MELLALLKTLPPYLTLISIVGFHFENLPHWERSITNMLVVKFPLLKACQLFGMSAIGRFHCSSHFRSSHRRCSIKKVLLKISQNSQESACARVSFLNKVPSLKPATLLKRDFGNSIIKRLIIYEKLICPMEWFRQREKCNCY